MKFDRLQASQKLSEHYGPQQASFDVKVGGDLSFTCIKDEQSCVTVSAHDGGIRIVSGASLKNGFMKGPAFLSPVHAESLIKAIRKALDEH